MDVTVTRFQEIYKSRSLRFGTAVEPAALTRRLSNLNQQRQKSRNTVMMLKRKIDEANLTPILSPAITEKKRKPAEAAENEHENKNDRLKMLRKWQEEKRKRAEQQKKTKKPLFKVCHVAATDQCDLTKVYSEIKGKPIDKKQPELVPSAEYQFKPPANVKPINMKSAGTTANKKPRKKIEVVPTQRVTRSQKPADSPLNLPKKERKKATEKKQQAKAVPRNAHTSSSSTSPPRVAKSQTPAKSLANLELPKNERNKVSKKKKQTKTEVQNENHSIYPDRPVEGDFNASPPRVAKSQTPAKSPANVESSRKATKKVTGKKQPTKTDAVDNVNSSLSPDFPVADNLNTTSSGTASPPSVCTPVNKSSGSTVYVSPFVTMSRGKLNARKEYHRRSIKGGPDGEKSTSPKAAAAYFYNLLNTQIERLRNSCHDWNTYKNDENPPEEACDMIDVAIGQTELLLTKKFQQFRGLVQTCESGDSDKPVTCIDLHGFWDMMSIQVDNLDKRFENLEKLRSNGWEEILPVPKPNKESKPKKKASKKTNTTSSSSLRAAIKEARRKKADNAQLLDTEEVAAISVPTTPESRKKRASRQNLRVSVLTSTTRRSIGSPGLMMMKVTQSAKSAEKSVHGTPSNDYTKTSPKSILKSQKTKPIAGKSKVVLFKENSSSAESEDQENDLNSSNITVLSPVATPRRKSVRLSKSVPQEQ